MQKYYGKLKPQLEEVDDLKFFPLNELPKQIAPLNKKAIRSYLDSKN